VAAAVAHGLTAVAVVLVDLGHMLLPQ